VRIEVTPERLNAVGRPRIILDEAQNWFVKANQSDNNPYKKLSLGEKGILAPGRQREVLIYGLGLDYWVRNTIVRGGRDWTITSYKDHFLEKGLSEIYKRGTEGIHFSGEAALADRIANETIMREEQKVNRWGELLNDARENPLLSDHGYKHERRVEILLEMILNNVWFLRHGEEKINGWLDSAFLAVSTHDMDQNLSQHRNLSGEKLRTKTGHGEASALLVWLLKDSFSKSGEFSQEVLLRKTTATMVFNLLHKQDKLTSRLQAKESASAYRYDPVALRDAWEQDMIDFITLTPQDILFLTRSIKGTADGFITNNTPNGLHQEVETEFRQQLNDLETGSDLFGSKTIGELLAFQDENDQKSFRHCLEAFVLADVLDMNLPPFERIFRSLMVPISRGRSLVAAIETDQDVAKVVNEAFADNGETQTDLQRWTWEAVHLQHVLGPESRLGNSTFWKKFGRETMIASLVGLQTTVFDLMAGSTFILDSVFISRSQDLIAKAGRRPPGEETKVALNEALEQLGKERDRLLDILRDKPVKDWQRGLPKSEAGILIYPPLGVFNTSEAITIILTKVGATEEEIEKAEDSSLLISYGYDCLGLSRPRTVHPL
jgi:hypothetical protein